jgi:uncharacterized protein (TIGR02646 family)
MKHIRKQQEPVEFTQWKEHNKDLNVTFDDLHSDVKNRVKQGLMVEQGYICCYCERRLEERDSHIEHLCPQDPYVDDALIYENMLCSCLQNTRRGEPLHCGVLRKNWYNEQYISPLEADCETRFEYTEAGEIRSHGNDRAADTTITKLGLNIDKLIALRYEAIKPFQDATLSPEELRSFVTGYLRLDSQGKFNPFYTTIRYLFQSA